MSTHGEKKVERLVIREISTELNKNGKISIAVIPSGVYESQVWQTSAEDLDRHAKACGFYDRFSFAKAVNSASDDSYLILPCTYCEEGKPIGFLEDGVTPIKNKNGSTTFEKSFWNVELLDVKIQASDDVIDFAREVTRTVAIDLAKESVKESQQKAREEKRRRDLERMGLKPDTTPTTETDGLGS